MNSHDEELARLQAGDIGEVQLPERPLINYLGLDWDQTSLLPQNNERRVATASNVQGRKEVYRGISEQCKKYQPFLNRAFDGLLSS